MTPQEQDAAFKKAVKLAAHERGALQDDTVGEVVRLLKLAAADVQKALESQPSDYLAWYLPQLKKQIERTLLEFGEDAGRAATAGQTKAWGAGQALIDRPLEAAAIRIVAELPKIDTGQLLAMQTFLTGKMRDVGLDTLNRVNGELALTVIGAQNVTATIDRVQEIMEGISRRRATTIVRTELGRAFATASQLRGEQAAEHVPGLKKQWRRSGKIHSRRKHDLTDGQVRPVDKPFILGTGKVSDENATAGIRIMYPHDPAAPPSETINCGCISLPYMESWAEAGSLANPGKKAFTAEEIALNPTKAELAEPGPTIGKIVDKVNLASPAFIGKARTVAGAERSAVRLGVKSADYEEDIAIGNAANTVLKLLQRRGLPLPDHVGVNSGIFEHWRATLGGQADDPAAFTRDRSTGETYLLLNPNDDYWAYPKMIADYQHQIGRWSTRHKFHALIHEAGHLAHFNASPTLYDSLLGQSLTAAESALAAKISEYAMENPREFVAETFAVLVTGGKVDPDVLSLYLSLGGRQP